jgi:methionyl aminopeptidase
MKTKSVKVGRNDPCPCGSGRKFKKCCLGKDQKDDQDLQDLYAKKYGIRVKNPQDIEGIRKAGRLVLETLDLVASNLQPGIRTDDINTMVHEFTIKNNATPAPLNYRGFPKSVCVSVNDVICHGIPGERVIKDGDIVNVDVTSILDGYYADANKTLFAGTPGDDARKIVNVTAECLQRGMAMVKPGNTLFVGHGVGFDFHEPPQIPHFGQKGQGVRLIQGMVFTVEPMINLGKKELRILDDNWTAITRDGSLSAQFEQTVLVTDSGFESLTPFEL